MRRRLDLELVRRGLAPSRSAAADLVASRLVLVGGAVATKPGRLVDPADALEVVRPARHVGRGGRKLEAAIDGFGLDVSGRRAIDVGSSTGGFTDCLLQHGAAQVVAIDVGRGQLHERLRRDDRVEVYEGTTVRGLDPSRIGGRASLVVADLSFISIRAVLEDLFRLAEPGADLVILVKPQFEAGRAEASRGRGVIRDPAIHRRVLLEVVDEVIARGGAIMDVMPAPIRGAVGNLEYLVHVLAPDPARVQVPPGNDAERLEALVDAAVDESART